MDNIISPQTIMGFGTLALTAASTAISTLTPHPSSPAYPPRIPPNETITIRNSINSGGNAYISPLGGTVTAANGIPLAPGESKTWGLRGRKTVPTAIADTTATLIVEW